MVNQQLLDYVRQQLQQGKSKEEIKQKLLEVGWSEAEVEETFNSIIGSNQTAEASTPFPSAQPQISALPGIGDLLKRSWQVYKEKFWRLVGIMVMGIMVIGMLVCFLVFILPFVIVAVFGVGGKILGGQWAIGRVFIFFIFLLAFLLSLIALMGVLLIVLFIKASLIFAIKEKDIGIGKALKLGWSKTLSLLWVDLLTRLAITGGSFLFIIPGIIFSVWFKFADYVLVVENLKGPKALSKSKFLVQGYWWNVFGKMFVLSILAGIVMLVLSFIPLIGVLIALVTIFPFSRVFYFLLYQDLKRLKEPSTTL